MGDWRGHLVVHLSSVPSHHYFKPPVADSHKSSQSLSLQHFLRTTLRTSCPLVRIETPIGTGHILHLTWPPSPHRVEYCTEHRVETYWQSVKSGGSPQGCGRGSVVRARTRHDSVHKGCHHMPELNFPYAEPDDLTWRVSTMSQALPPIAPTAYILFLEVIPLKQVWCLSPIRTLI